MIDTHERVFLMIVSKIKAKLLLLIIATFMISQAYSEPDPNFHIYLLFGQSNMAGGGASTDIIAEDCDTSPRVKVLAFCDCPTSGSGTWTSSVCDGSKPKRIHDQWYTAYPPLHICTEGVSPGDWFAKTMLDSVRSDIKIGLIPCALSGQALLVFTKGGSNFNIPTWAHPTIGNSSPYNWMLQRCKLAQQTGVIKGILLHQGESGAGSTSISWVELAKGIFDNLKKDLGLDSDIPVIVGELRQSSGSCCASFNKNIETLSKTYPNCGLASSAGLPSNGIDPYHFNSLGMREMGKRYAKALLLLSSEEYIPRKETTIINNKITGMQRALKSSKNGISIYSLNGRFIHSYSATDVGKALKSLKTSMGVLIISQRLDDGRTAIVPLIE